jgi:hypothetical protein
MSNGFLVKVLRRGDLRMRGLRIKVLERGGFFQTLIALKVMAEAAIALLLPRF